MPYPNTPGPESHSRYGDFGVDVHKKGIGVFQDRVSGIYKHAFCDIHPDPDMPGHGYVHASDGAGSKPVQNYLNWKETGDIGSFSGIAQDVLAMNIGDAMCVGVPTSCSFVDYVAINGLHVPKSEVLNILAEEWGELFDMLNGYGININFAGGETADLPDQLKTFDVSGAIHARYKLGNVITGEAIMPGDIIIGVESGGQASYENAPSGPIMCNGLTLARHCLMLGDYGTTYPEIHEKGKEYIGPFKPTDRIDGIDVPVGQELTKPTRVYAPIQAGVLNGFGTAVHGMVFNTGGGHTKCLRVGKNILYIKDNLPEPPAVFNLVQEHGEVPWAEMHEDFNMGTGLEIHADPVAAPEIAQYVREEFGLCAERIGECGESEEGNELRLDTGYGNFKKGPNDKHIVPA